jgi:hypothetical protein
VEYVSIMERIQTSLDCFFLAVSEGLHDDPTMAGVEEVATISFVTKIIRIAVYESEINVDTIHTMGYSIVRLHMTLRDRYGTNKRCNPSYNVLYAASTITGVTEE